jgi:hypothetical protein
MNTNTVCCNLNIQKGIKLTEQQGEVLKEKATKPELKGDGGF